MTKHTHKRSIIG